MALSTEAEKIDSLRVFKRLLWPIKPQIPESGTSDGHLLEEYPRMFDPLRTLGFVALSKMDISFKHDTGKYVDTLG